ncbi:hypothetical protein C0992_010384, partial [Termitomyces sp. T32_za158]
DSEELNLPFMKLTLNADGPMILGEQPFLYRVPGRDDLLTFTPRFHFSKDHVWFMAMVNAVLLHHVNGQPRYLSDNPDVRASSVIEIMTSKQYDSISGSEVLSKLAQRNLVIIEDHAIERDFNEDTLRLLGSLEASVNIHG